ncbi:MAG: glycosyltransferase family 4 protein [bacterium]|nr:glycosyltransferase family 4 protein [bacterium]
MSRKHAENDDRATFTHKNTEKDRPHLAIVFHRFGPYHRVRIESCTKHFRVTGVELSRDTSEYAWDQVLLDRPCNHVVICEDGDSRNTTAAQLSALVNEKLTPLKPDLVAVNGWADCGALATLRWCQKHDVPAILMSESNQMDFQRRWWRESIKKQIVGLFAAAIVGGKLSRDYLIKLGMPSDRILVGYDVIDNAHFERPPAIDLHKIKQITGIASPYFLASNRFIKKKNLGRLLESYSAYRSSSESLHPGIPIWDLVLLGDGPLADQLKTQVNALQIGKHVHFPGFKQYRELPPYYWGAGAFCHVSTTEQWGLVINEAMASGLPVVVSDRCGCVPDLVVDEQNGFTVDPKDIGALTDAMLRIASDAQLQTTMGQESLKRISQWGPERFAFGMRNAVNAAQQNSKNSNWFDHLVLSLLCR